MEEGHCPPRLSGHSLSNVKVWEMEFNFIKGQGRLLYNYSGARPLIAPITPGTNLPHLSQESHIILFFWGGI